MAMGTRSDTVRTDPARFSKPPLCQSFFSAAAALMLSVAAPSVFSFVAPNVVPARHRHSAVFESQLRMVISSDTLQYSVDVPYKEADYQPVAADAFFRARPLALLQRFARLAQLSGGFVSSLMLDKALKREEDPAIIEARSQQLLALVTNLGPTFIKVGQALSIRTDLLPAPYVAGLTQLQDAVPPFDGALGRAIIESELGIDLDRTFSTISLEPVASASIGQVYRATVRETRQEVAVKVQRPQVLYNVALDLFMMREILVPRAPKASPRRSPADLPQISRQPRLGVHSLHPLARLPADLREHSLTLPACPPPRGRSLPETQSGVEHQPSQACRRMGHGLCE